jgi:Tfp pilus assembly protein PilX
MRNTRHHSPGFTLIASLLLLLLLSGIAIGLMMMVNTESRVGGADLQNNAAYHSAEGGVEKMSADLAATFQNAQSPTASQICNLGTLQPSMAGVTWKDYSVTPASGCSGALAANFGQITAGPSQGLWAQIIPVTMLATAAEPGGQEVSMTRQAQVALIPVFQFGVFSESDLSFFSGPDFGFAGRVHTNQDLYPFVGGGSTLTFHDRVSVYGNVVRANLANGFAPGNQYNGTVQIPTQSAGCDGAKPHCRALGLAEGSVTGAGGIPPQSGQNTTTPSPQGWNTVSLSSSYYNGEIIDGNYGTPGGTGAKKLSLPFVNGTLFPYEIIRRPQTGESATSSLGQSREYNMAQIRVLLSDDPAELCSGCVEDANNVRLANVGGASPSNQFGIATSVPAALTAAFPLAAGSYVTYFAAASNAVPLPSTCVAGTATCTQDWLNAPATPAAAYQTLVPTASTTPPGAPIYSSNGTPATIGLCPPVGVNPAVFPPTPPVPANCPTGAYPYYVPPNGAAPSNSASSTNWNLIDGYLRVEYKDANAVWHPVTMEWLQLGFARGLKPPTAPGGAAPPAGKLNNPVNPDAILLLQEPADRDASGILDPGVPPPACPLKKVGSVFVCKTWTPGTPPEVAAETQALGAAGWWEFGITNPGAPPAAQSITQYNWYPINFYDVREGEARDVKLANNSCTTNGVMNAVEIDVGNLKRWLRGQIGTNGGDVDFLTQNGYVLYFSDRRGMLKNPNPPYGGIQKSGDSGLEDVINSSSNAGTPDGLREPTSAGRTAFSPEDTNQNTFLDNFGTKNLGLGFWGTQGNAAQNLNALIIGTNPNDPYGTAANARINSCGTTARKNWVSGARHVLKLVDGSLGNVPLRTDAGVATTPNKGGFTVASENPVYIQGDYNSDSTDTTWNATPTDKAGMAAAAVIADAVTVLSNNWDDRVSLMGNIPVGGANNSVTDPGARVATNTWYRVAIAGGKNMIFPQPIWGAQDMGTDGGVHNFLRYLENWGGRNLNYKGSLVSLYYATYNTGVYKCCTAVYSPPTRNYFFDSDFALPAGLPPGTPLFRDVDSLGYRQLFTARTN